MQSAKKINGASDGQAFWVRRTPAAPAWQLPALEASKGSVGIQLSLMQWVCTLAAVLTFGLALVWLLAPEAMLSLWHLSSEHAPTVYMARRFAGMFFGYGVLLWLARRQTPSRATFAIHAASATIMGGSGALSVYGALSGVAGPVAWIAATIEFGGFVIFSCLAAICKKVGNRTPAAS